MHSPQNPWYARVLAGRQRGSFFYQYLHPATVTDGPARWAMTGIVKQEALQEWTRDYGDAPHGRVRFKLEPAHLHGHTESTPLLVLIGVVLPERETLWANAAPADPPKLAVYGEWLVHEVGGHNCGMGPDGYYGSHEPGCGTEPLARVADIEEAIRASRQTRATDAMTDLPAVPEEATSVATEVYRHWRDNALAHVVVGRVLAAALPHLYAAALRHAADRIEADWPRPLPMYGQGTLASRDAGIIRAATKELRRMADETVQR